MPQVGRLVAPAVRAAGVEEAQAVIVPEKADLGATPWERKLVERLKFWEREKP